MQRTALRESGLMLLVDLIDIRRGAARRRLAWAVCAAVIAAPASGADNVVGNLINFDNDGFWSWYMDERAIVDEINGKLLIGSVSSSPVRFPTGRPTGGGEGDHRDRKGGVHGPDRRAQAGRALDRGLGHA